MNAEELKSKIEDDRAKLYSALAAIISLGFWMRYRPASSVEYLQALDPYMLFTMSKHFALEGSLPVADYLRYFPYNMPVYKLYTADLVIPALLYNAGPQYLMSYLSWAKVYPALMGAFSIGAMYLFTSEMRDRTAGIVAAFLLAVLPGALRRTSAGFFEKEPTSIFLMMLSLYGFTAAWRREDWRFGILSGLTLGISSATWGGTQMVWLLLPLSTGIILFLDEDIESIVASYTPAVLIGAVTAVSLSSGDYGFLDQIFFANYALLTIAWIRYLAEEFSVISTGYKWITPSIYFSGFIAAVLSPLYSPGFVAKKVLSIVKLATQNTGGVIAGTVAENQAASSQSFISQLSFAASANANFLPGSVSTVAGLLGTLIGPLSLAYLFVGVSSGYVMTMIAAKYGLLEDLIPEKRLFQIYGISMLLWTVLFSLSFQNPSSIVSVPILLFIAGSVCLYYLDELGSNIELKFDWIKILAILFVASNLVGAATKSRLLFLSSYPVAFGAAIMLSSIKHRFSLLSKQSLEYSSLLATVLITDILVFILSLQIQVPLIPTLIFLAAANAVIWKVYDDRALDRFNDLVNLHRSKIPVVVTTLLFLGSGISAGYATSNTVSGSPNEFWIENMQFLESEVEPDEVVLSWWDYGYWFGNLGGRASVADGGNFGYYTNDDKVNVPLARLLTAENLSEHRQFLKKHSVDYMVLDSTMIGKYSAVSQISNEDNSVYGRLVPVRTMGYEKRQTASNDTVVSVSGRIFNINIPVNSSSNSVSVTSAPTLSYRLGRSQARGKVSCYIDSSGERTFELDGSEQPLKVPSNLFGTEIQSDRVEVCLAERPTGPLENILLDRAPGYVVVPKPMKDDLLVELYLGDGSEVEEFSKIESGSNRFVKTWEYNPSNTTAE